MYKICFYVPVTHIDAVKNAMFSAGAGKIGNYICSAWQVLGEGQFMPFSGSNPFIGKQGSIEKLPEFKVEMVCEDHFIKIVIEALKAAHPYEEPAYQVIKLEDF